MNNNDTTLLSLEIIPIKAVKKIIMGEPSIVAKHVCGKTTAKEETSVLNERLPECQSAVLVIRTILEVIDDVEFENIIVNIICTEAKEKNLAISQIKNMLTDNPPKSNKKIEKIFERSPDSLYFLVNNKTVTLCTTSNGYHGSATRYKDGNGANISLSFSGDMLSHDELKLSFLKILEEIDDGLVTKRDAILLQDIMLSHFINRGGKTSLAFSKSKHHEPPNFNTQTDEAIKDVVGLEDTSHLKLIKEVQDFFSDFDSLLEIL